MNIYEITSENFKKLTAVQLTLDGKGVVITGKNGVGKSSFIDAIFTTLTGKEIPPNPIHKGKESAKNVVKIKQDDGTIIIVEKSFKNNTTSLVVKTESGSKYPSPQKFLNDTIGNITFDPFEWINLQPIDQKRFLMKLLGLDFTDIDKRKRTLLDEKDDIYKDEIRVSKSIDLIPILKGYDKKKDPADILKKQQEINEIQKSKGSINNEIESLAKNIKGLEERKLSILESKKYNEDRIIYLLTQIEEMKKEIESLEVDIKTNKAKHISKIESTIESNNDTIGTLLEKYDAIEVPEFEGEKLLEEIKEFNLKVDEQVRRKGLVNELEEVEGRKREKLDKIQEVENEKIALINSVKMPVEGLAFSDDGLTFEGLELSDEQLSKGKILEIGVAIQIALNPTLRIMRITDGSLLDSEMLGIIKNACKNNDYQLFLEKVTDDGEIGFIVDEEN